VQKVLNEALVNKVIAKNASFMANLAVKELDNEQ
jgi:hypothetical protein